MKTIEFILLVAGSILGLFLEDVNFQLFVISMGVVLIVEGVKK